MRQVLNKRKSSIILLFISLGMLFQAFSFVEAISIGEEITFNINSSYDANDRNSIQAVLKKITPKAYFFIDSAWWEPLSYENQTEVNEAIKNLTVEFDKIYSKLTLTFGSEWSPGIDNDVKVTILIHPMKKNAGGYFNPGDEYPLAQVITSNEREMVYINANYITSNTAKSLLAHEFMHLITFNQKDRMKGVSEEIWLNELRAEIAPTIVGYDDVLKDSNLEKRMNVFLKYPSDSLTEWKETEQDYGVINLFGQYLIDQYGISSLSTSLLSKEVGIISLNYSLQQIDPDITFSKVFNDWMIAVLVNNCDLGEKYCFKNKNLIDLRVSPSLVFLPITKETTVSATYLTKNWSGNWYKFIGGKGDLELKFDGADKTKFFVAYVMQNVASAQSINFIELDDSQNGRVVVSNFGTDNVSLILLPFVHDKITNFGSDESFYTFSFSASVVGKDDPELINQLLAKIEELKKEVVRLTALLKNIPQKPIGDIVIKNDLYYGMKGKEVEILQQFLKSQGEEIYPEGYITGFFGNLTQKAVIKFQNKYYSEILTPFGLISGNGYVGKNTRAKISSISASE
ncbi:MAG: peptidoglycan-binding domain-containing protein [Patescibacteria group bacterium]